MKGPRGPHVATLLSPSESHVLWRDRATLRVYDLDTRELVYEDTGPGEGNVSWIGDTHLLIAGPPSRIVDLRTRTATTLALAGGVALGTSAVGNRVIARMPGGELRVFVIGTDESVVLATSAEARTAALSRRESWVAVAESDGATSLRELDGRKLARVDIQAFLIVPTDDDGFILVGGATAYRCHRRSEPVCAPITFGAAKPAIFTTGFAAAGSVFLISGGGELHVVEGDRHDRFYLPSPTSKYLTGSPGGFFGAERDAIYVPTRVGWVPLTLPEGLRRSRVVTGQRRVVAFGDEVIGTFELARWLPRRFPTEPDRQAVYVSDETIATFRGEVVSEVEWRDARTLDVVGHAVLDAGVLAASVTTVGNLIGMSPFSSPDAFEVLRVPHRGTASESIATSRGLPIVSSFIDGVPLVVRDDDEVVVGASGHGELSSMKLPGRVVTIAPLSTYRFAALLATNELVIGDPRARTLERHALPVLPENVALATDGEEICVVLGEVVSCWRGGRLVEIARLARQPIWIGVHAGALIAAFRDRPATVTELATGSTTVVSDALSGPVWTNVTLSVLGTLDTPGEAALYNLDTQVVWNVPLISTLRGATRPALSPDGHRLLTMTTTGTYVYQLHETGPDLHAWLEQATNARITDGKMTWDWASKARLAP
jgi:hypothetical protein